MEGAETMPENVTQDANPPTTEAARAARRREKRERGESMIDDVREELQNRAKRAATAYYLNKGKEDAPTISQLMKEFGVQHRTSLTRMIDRMREQEQAFALAREYADCDS
eukprot:1900490-Rhodomonas_salina.1